MKTNGLVLRDIYQNPRPAKVYQPVFDDHFVARVPAELMKIVPKDNLLLVYYEAYEGNEQLIYHVIYYRQDNGHWYDAAILYDNPKGKWTDGRTTRIYGGQFRADRENQWWTRSGFEKAKADNKLDPQMPAVWANYVKFYGRNEALCRLGLPPVTAGFDERDFEEGVDKYEWYADQRVH